MSYEIWADDVQIIRAQGVLFDMDGVLVSSIASVDRCWRRWAAHFGVVGAEQLQIKHGTRAVDIILKLKPEWRGAPDEVQRMDEALRLIEDLEIADVMDLKVLPGVKALLASLPAERWTIVTSATRRLLLARLTAAGLPCPAKLVAGDDVVNGKPHPEPYTKGAAMLGFTPGQCVVVEDAPTGVGAGRAAGSRVLGVLGTHAAEELYAAGAEWVVQSLEEVRMKVEADDILIEFAPVGGRRQI